MGLSIAQEDEAVTRYLAGEGADGIAKSYGYATGKAVQRVLVARGVYEEGRKFVGRYSAEQKAQVVSRYLAGETMAALAAEYGCDRGNIRAILSRRGVEFRPQGKPAIPAEDDDIRGMRADGLSIREVAEALGLNKHRVLQRCRALGIAEKKMPTGPKSSVWKGGRTYRHATGYLYVAVGLDDPMRVMASTNGQVPEHRLVMARSLGRPLTRGETVHHINGDRTDNRIENLQLRKGQHGKGAVYACLDCGSHNVGPMPLA